MSRVSNEERVKQGAGKLIEKFIHSSAAKERQGLAQCLGLIGAVHPGAVLTEVRNSVAVHVAAKETGFGNFFSLFKSDRSVSELEHAKSTLALALGHVTKCMPAHRLGAMLDSDVVRPLVPLLRGLKVGGLPTLLKLKSLLGWLRFIEFNFYRL